ncbi:MAG TPA: Ig-like domain-containing protein [Tepidisphaeraceae bacterium]|nr:Ig-like domain-containing protein [Tepidisphaeraceae bacterium]
MSTRKSAGQNAGRRNRSHAVLTEALEPRQLLSTVSFGAPISTALPAGFQPAQVLMLTGSNGDSFSSAVLVTSASGGGLLMHANSDGTFTLAQQINTTGVILGAFDVNTGGGNSVPTIVTTAGLMTQQGGGSFSAPSGLAYPSDAVPGANAFGFFSQGAGPNLPDLVVERFHPNSGDPTHGSLILADFPTQSNATYGAEVDTTIATNVSGPLASGSLTAGNFTFSGTDLVVNNSSMWVGTGNSTFTAGPTLNLAGAGNAPLYTGFFGGSTATQDLVAFPAATTASDPNFDAAQTFTNDGRGNFTATSRIDMAPKGTTAGPLVLQDFTKDTTTDLAVAQISGTGAPQVVIAPSKGDGTFFPIETVSVQNLKSVVGINPATSGMLCLTATTSGEATTYSLATLPNLTTTGPLVTLAALPNPGFVGQPVTFTANQSLSQSFPAGGTVSFKDGSTQIGTATVQPDGTATFTTSTLSAGVHTITAVENFGGNVTASSAPVTETINADPLSGLITARSMSVLIPSNVVPGDKGKLEVTVSSVGTVPASGKVNITLLASDKPVLDSSAIPIPVPAFDAANVHLGINKSTVLKAPLVIPDTMPPGTYYLIAQVNRASSSTGAQVVQTNLVSSTPISVAWQFGDVGSRHNVKFVRHLTGGGTVTFTLKGGGTGTVSTGNSPVTLGTNSPDYQVTIDATSPASKLVISQSGGTAANIASLTLNGNLGILDVRGDTPHVITPGTVENSSPATLEDVSVGKLMIGTLPPATLAPGANPTTSLAPAVTITGTVGLFSANTITGANVTLGTAGLGQPLEVKIAHLAAGSTFQSELPVSKMQFGSADAGSSVSAPNISSLTTTSDFDAGLTVTGSIKGATVLGTVKIGGSVVGASLGADRWAVNGNIGKLQVKQNIKDLQLLAGALLGPNGELTTPPAAYSGTQILSLKVGGAISTSLIAAGLDPVDGLLLNGNDQLLPGGAIGSLFAGAGISADSRLVAESIPDTVIIQGSKVSTAGDQRFKLS